MKYEGIIIRPPSEANSLIFQITTGCSHNRCTFCPAYKAKKFRIKSHDEILADVDEAALTYGEDVRRVFLCDGDPLIIPHHNLLTIFNYIGQSFKKLQRIGMYANAKSILRKSIKELTLLKQKKLGIIYMGLESGDPVVLKDVQKGVTREQMIEASLRIHQAGIKLSVTVILGLGGRARTVQHAVETIHALNTMKPHYVGALTLMIVPGTPIHEQFERGDFVIPDRFEIVEELRTMIAESQLENCLFFSNHASNYLPVQARLSRDKEKVLKGIDSVLKRRDEKMLRPEFLRGL